SPESRGKACGCRARPGWPEEVASPPLAPPRRVKRVLRFPTTPPRDHLAWRLTACLARAPIGDPSAILRRDIHGDNKGTPGPANRPSRVDVNVGTFLRTIRSAPGGRAPAPSARTTDRPSGRANVPTSLAPLVSISPPAARLLVRANPQTPPSWQTGPSATSRWRGARAARGPAPPPRGVSSGSSVA